MKNIIALLFILLSFTCPGQTNQSWRSFFSYYNTIDITQSGNSVYAASESAVFSKSMATNELKTVTSVDGLKAEGISAIHHSSTYNKTLVGNENGLLLVVNADNSVAVKIGVLQEATIQPNKKKINHIYEFQGKAYLSCDFGIAVFDLATLEFGDTYYLGPSGSEIPVLQCAVHNGYIYAATPNNGMRRALFGHPNLNDFNEWIEYGAGAWTTVASYNGNLFGGTPWGAVYRLQGNSFVYFAQLPTVVLDLREANGYLVATSAGQVFVFNTQFFPVLQVTPGQVTPDEATFTCATVVSERVFIGTTDKGVFSSPLNFPTFQNITPNGPLRNNIWSLEKTANNLWAVFGGYNYYLTPNQSAYGISKFNEEAGWLNIPYDEVLGAKSLTDIAVKPNDENEVFIASFHSGLLKIVNDQPVMLYDNDPPIQNGPQTISNPGFLSVQINSLAFDRNNNLWMTNSQVQRPLKVLKPGGWSAYSFEGITGGTETDRYTTMVIDRNGTKWIGSRDNGIIAFNENNNKFIVISGEAGNLPVDYVRSLAIDNRNQLWIGTVRGLRVLSGIDRFSTENELTTNPIIIIEDDLAQELMYEQAVIDIAVDGANNKWLATAGAGAFLVSPDGQRTLFHFTKENSPLPSNTINDIEIDAVTGDVYFATDRGTVSYQGTSTKASDNLNNVYVFPNPVRPGFEGDVNISGLIDRANIKITDIEGNLVYETTSEGGTVLWDTRAFGRYKVASGVYMIFIASDDGTQTKVKKVMIVR